MDKQELLNMIEDRISTEKELKEKAIDDSDWMIGYRLGRLDVWKICYKKLKS